MKKTIKTVCSICGLAGCGMEVTVEDEKVVKVEGDKTHPENRGALCIKGHAAMDILYAPDRLEYPLKRIGRRGEGKWERISWDEALNLIAEKLQAVKATYGPEAVWFHKGSGHDNCVGDVRGYLHRLANVFGTPNLSCPFYICNGPRVLNMFLLTGAIPSPDVENTQCALLWGINPADSALPRRLKIQDARKRGARLVVVDPRTTHFARQADVHLQPRPGTDGALALAMIKVIVDENLYDAEFVAKWTVGFDELKALLATYSLADFEKITWVSQNDIQKAARLYATTKPACIFLGQSLDQHTGSSQAIRAITTLIAVSGNLDVPGGNVIYSPGRLAKNSIELHEMLAPEQAKKRLGNQFLLTDFEFTRLAHPPSGYKAILEETPYPIKAMFIMAANPLLADPNSQQVRAGLEKLDFLAVADITMSATAQLADVVLPACTFLEQTYYATYEAGAYSKPTFPGLLKLRPQVVPPLAESWPDWKIIFELARKLGYGEYFPWKDIEEAIDYELKPMGITVRNLREHPNGISIPGPSFLYQRFANKGLAGKLIIKALNRTIFRTYPQMYRKYKKLGFMTRSKKVEIFSEQLKEKGYDALPVYHEPSESLLGNTELAKAFPLVLTTGAKVQPYVHSQLRKVSSLNRHMPHNLAEVHPATARLCGIADGDQIAVESPRGSVQCQAKVSDGIHPQVVQLFHGFEVANANLLTDDRAFDPITGAVPMRSSLCRIRKIEG